MKFCQACGSEVELIVPDKDDRKRHVCMTCNEVHYLNPRIIVCTLPCFENKVLLCKRSIEPRYGYWTVPGGFMENDETIHEGAIRETLEEACARIELHELYSYFSLPHINQAHFFFRSTLTDLEFAAGEESLEVGLFSEHEIPWEEIAFIPVAETLKHYFNDLKAGFFTLRSADILLSEEGERLIKAHD